MRSPSPPSSARRWVISAPRSSRAIPAAAATPRGCHHRPITTPAAAASSATPMSRYRGRGSRSARRTAASWAGRSACRPRGAGRPRAQQQRDGDEPGNLLARLRLIPSSSPLTWSFPLAFTILSALTQGPAVTLADRRPRCAEVPVRLRTGRGTPKWLVRALPADCGAGVHDATPQENSGQVSCQSLRDRGALARTSGRPAADRRAPGGLAREPVPDTRARRWPGRTRAGAAAGAGAPPPPPRGPGAR